MIFEPLRIAGAFRIKLEAHTDNRGEFARIFCKRDFAALGLDIEFVQINHSWNLKKGVFRGLHYQIPPKAETKLIRCVNGSVLDIIVDLRKHSSTFLEAINLELTAANREMVLIPPGCAHGFISTEDDSQLIYHHTEYYSPEHEAGIRYNDPRIRNFPPIDPKIISDRDRSHARLTVDFDGLDQVSAWK
jgi:dTDP-4-dehydrorhamnose 3,5-epimerase